MTAPLKLRCGKCGNEAQPIRKDVPSEKGAGAFLAPAVYCDYDHEPVEMARVVGAMTFTGTEGPR